MSRILFIHPDHKLVGIYQKHLSRHFMVDSAHDGMMGLRKIRETKPGLIVSDHDLKYMTGLALLSYVRKHPEMFATPFLFLTKTPMPHEALGFGANGWFDQNLYGPDWVLPHIYSNYQLSRSRN